VGPAGGAAQAHPNDRELPVLDGDELLIKVARRDAAACAAAIASMHAMGRYNAVAEDAPGLALRLGPILGQDRPLAV